MAEVANRRTEVRPPFATSGWARAHDLPAERELRAESLLLERAVAGDERAFTELYDLHYDRVYRYAYFRTRREQDAEDLCQRIFLNAWRALGRYRQTQTPFAGWLLTIAHNETVSHRRSVRPEEPMTDEVSDSVHHEDVADQVVRTEEAELLLNALFELNSDQQQVIYQRFVDGFAYGEIAKSIGKSEGAVRAIQHRALRRLRDLLRRQVL